MKRRDFLALAGASLVPFSVPRTARGGSEFAVHFRRANPYEPLLRYIEPGSDEFKGEKAAVELEHRLGQMFQGKQALPAKLESWAGRLSQIRAARFNALPENLVRYEIKTTGKYHTGLWRLPDFSTVAEQTASSAKPLFRDVTSHVFGNTQSFRDQLLNGNPWWRARLDSATGIDVYGNQGIAVGDIDNDGVDEIYVCQPGGLAEPILQNPSRRHGGRHHRTRRCWRFWMRRPARCSWTSATRVIRTLWRCVLRARCLFLNQGDGTFREQPDAFRFKTTPQGSFTGMAAADYDRDGRLDLYLCCYVYFQSEDQYQYPAPYHDAKNGPPNFMFRNLLTDSGGTFDDVTEEVRAEREQQPVQLRPGMVRLRWRWLARSLCCERFRAQQSLSESRWTVSRRSSNRPASKTWARDERVVV